MILRSTGRSIAAVLVILTVGPLVPTTLAVVDPSPPTGTFSQPTYDPGTNELVITTSFSDPESGVASVATSCDGGPEFVRPYATTVRIPALDPAAGGCPAFGVVDLLVRVFNGAGASTDQTFRIDLQPVVTFDYPLPARTGERFTIRPVYTPGYVPPPDAMCRWEFRWGDTASLRDNEFNETFGFVLFEGTAGEGFCSEWTFTLPWVPVPQFELDFRGSVPTARSGSWPVVPSRGSPR